MIFRRRRSSICQDKARRLFRTAYRGDSACQDKPAQMIFQDKTRRRPLSGQGADDIQDGLSGGFSLPGQNAAQAAFRTAYWGGFSLPGQGGAGRFQDKAQMIFRTAYRGDSACQDKARRLFRTAYRGDSACQDKAAQAAFRTRRR